MQVTLHAVRNKRQVSVRQNLHRIKYTNILKETKRQKQRIAEMQKMTQAITHTDIKATKQQSEP